MVIASKAKQSEAKHRDSLLQVRLLRRFTPRNDLFSFSVFILQK
jgi:hypothetical protein